MSSANSAITTDDFSVKLSWNCVFWNPRMAVCAFLCLPELLYKSAIRILGRCKQSKVFPIAALRISANMVHHKPVRNWSNKQLIDNSMHHFRNRVAACFNATVFQLVRLFRNMTSPLPAIGFGVYLNAFKEALPDVSAWSSCSHSKKPTRAPKVKSANERPQSGHELENRLFSFFWRLLQSRALNLQNAV